MMTLIAILLLSSIGIILFFPWFKREFDNYSRKKAYLPILKKIQFLYQDVNPYELSLKARSTQDPTDLVYGEVSLCTLLDLMQKTLPKANERFYDLGSGDGKTLLTIKLRYPTLKVKGIELIPSLHQIAQLQAQRLQQMDPKQSLDITPICDNFLNYSFHDADIVFINATGLSSELWSLLADKLSLLKPGSRIILTSKRLPSPTFREYYRGMEKMSWGLTSTYIYEKIL